MLVQVAIIPTVKRIPQTARLSADSPVVASLFGEDVGFTNGVGDGVGVGSVFVLGDGVGVALGSGVVDGVGSEVTLGDGVGVGVGLRR